MRLELKLPKTTDLDNLIEKSELEEMDYDNRWGAYRIRLNKEISKNNKLFSKIYYKKPNLISIDNIL